MNVITRVICFLKKCWTEINFFKVIFGIKQSRISCRITYQKSTRLISGLFDKKRIKTNWERLSHLRKVVNVLCIISNTSDFCILDTILTFFKHETNTWIYKYIMFAMAIKHSCKTFSKLSTKAWIHWEKTCDVVCKRDPYFTSIFAFWTDTKLLIVAKAYKEERTLKKIK